MKFLDFSKFSNGGTGVRVKVIPHIIQKMTNPHQKLAAPASPPPANFYSLPIEVLFHLCFYRKLDMKV